MTIGAIDGLRSFSDGGVLTTVSPGSAATQGGGTIVLGASTTVSVGATGIGGLDCGTVAANQLYALYLVQQGTTVGAVLSLSFNGPSGSFSFRRIGAVLTNANAQVVPFTQNGTSSARQIEYQGTPNVLVLVNAGASPSGFTQFDLSPPNPPGTRTTRLHIVPSGGTTTLRTGAGGGEISIVEPTTLGFTPPIGTDHGSFHTSGSSTTTLRITGYSDTL